ncbi:amidohydrolase family protein [Gemmatimonadota bacterium]
MRVPGPLATAALLHGAGVAAFCLPGPFAVGQVEAPVAFVNVNVLPMDREQVLEGYTVLVEGGLISEMAPAHRVRVPYDAKRIPGEGLFLMPGLADMHAHFPETGASSDRIEDLFFLFLANNITVIRGMSGASSHLDLRAQTASGRMLGPTLYLGAPPLSGDNARSPDSAERLLQAHRSAGYNFQKILPGVPLESWDRLASSAHSMGFTFGGHIPEDVGLRHALSTGISVVDHLDGYLEEVVSDEVQARRRRGEDVSLGEALASVRARKMRAIAAHTRSSNAWVVPTLQVMENQVRGLDVDSVLALPEMDYVSAEMRRAWVRQKAGRRAEEPEVAEALTHVRGRILRALQMAGVGILMGTDSPQMFNVPGFSLRHEIRSMSAAGLTPYEILVSGTRNVATYVREELLRDGNFGTVETGNRADLVLLRNNPLENLDHLWDQEGVMVRGRWISRAEIDDELARIAEENRGG